MTLGCRIEEAWLHRIQRGCARSPLQRWIFHQHKLEEELAHRFSNAMRLLDAWLLIHEGIAELVNFPDERAVPPYAILSHTWEDEEVQFDDIPLGPNHEIVTSRATLRASRWQRSSNSELPASSTPHVKAGWNKVLNTCLRACQDELEYIWIDTCCEFLTFDMSSSCRPADVC